MPKRKRQARYARYSEWDRERHGIDRAVPSAPEKCEAMADVVCDVMGRLGLDAQVWQQQLEQDWVGLMGEQVARHARPGGLDRGILYIYVSNSVWLSELKRGSEPVILEKLKKQFGEDKIKGIQLRLDPDLQA